jgi:HK97 family phage major capsid protein
MSTVKKVQDDLAAARAELAAVRAAQELAGQTVNKAVDVLGGQQTVPATARDPLEEGRWGFKSFGHFIHEVKRCPKPDVPSDFITKAYAQEYVRKAALGMGELVGSEGGFLVPPTFSNAIFGRVYNDNALLAKTDGYPLTGSNQMTFPRTAETSRVDGSRWGGVRSYWVQEGSTITASNPTFGKLTLNLHKLATVVPLTGELKQDTGGTLETYLTKVFSSEITFETGKAIFRGNGVGRPLGFMNAACAITVSKELGQAAATILPVNIEKMWSRRFALGPTGQYLWLINQDVGPQLGLLTQTFGTSGQMVNLPPGGVSVAPYQTLKGAPVMETEFNSTLGTVGDIALVDLSQYVTVNAGGPQTMNSLHIYFLSDQEAIRTLWRIDGQPWWPAALTPYQGTNTQSPFILLETR